MTYLKAMLTVVALLGVGEPSMPALPHESHGACPFECCTYGTWSVQAETNILADRRDGARVVFRLRRGEQADGITGVVVTTKLGRAVVRRAATIGVGPHPVTVRPGDDVFILHYVGEGYWRFWVAGVVDDDQLPAPDDPGCKGGCDIQITEEPETTWWAKVRSQGQEGWTRQLDHFDGIDACG